MIDRDAEHNDRMVDLLSGRDPQGCTPLVPSPPWPFPTPQDILNEEAIRHFMGRAVLSTLGELTYYQYPGPPVEAPVTVVPGEVRCWWMGA